MVNLEDAVVARLKTHGQVFEVLVDCEHALKAKDGVSVLAEDLLADEKVFSDQKKGLRAADSELESIFGTTAVFDIACQIIAKGEVQLNAHFRAKLREQKKNKVMEKIHRNGVDPRTHMPIPLKRLELAVTEAKINVDEMKSVDQNVSEIVQKLQPILPIRFEQRQIQVHLPAKEAEKAYKLVGDYGTKLKDEWKDDGSYVLTLEIPAGLQDEFFAYLNKLTQGNNDIHILK